MLFSLVGCDRDGFLVIKTGFYGMGATIVSALSYIESALAEVFVSALRMIESVSG